MSEHSEAEHSPAESLAMRNLTCGCAYIGAGSRTAMPFQHDWTWTGRWRWKRCDDSMSRKTASKGAFSSAVPFMSRATQLWAR
jgi:hypothetical protein